MCVIKLTQKQLEAIIKEASEADKSTEEKEVASYERPKRYSVAEMVQHYDDVLGYKGNS